MKLRKAINRIVAIGTGLTMVGATILGASAADLSGYPGNFIKDGAFNGVIVVGEKAQSSDTLGAVDIATNLQYSSTTASTTGSGSSASVTITGDAFRVDKSTNFLEIEEELDQVISAKLTDDEIDALASGKIVNEKGSFTYNQYLSLPEQSRVVFVSDPDDDNSVVKRYLRVVDSTRTYVYKIEFPTPAESDVDAEDDIDDLEGKKVTLLGTEYTVTGSDNSTLDLQLMGGAIEATMQEYETKKFTINGVDYEVEVVSIATESSTNKVVLKVNSQITNKLVEGDTYKLNDGTEIGIRTVTENEGTETGGGDIVTFFLGAKKIRLKDATELEVSGEKMDGTTVTWSTSYSVSDSVRKINSISVNFTAQDDYYIAEGGKLSEKLDEKDALFGRGFDLEYAGEVKAATEEIKLQQKNKNELRMVFPQGDGSETTLPIVYVGGTANMTWGDDTHDTYIDESLTNVSTGIYTISKNDYFVVSKDKRSTVLQYKGHSHTTNQTTFKNVGNSESWQETLTVGATTGTMKVGGEEFTYWIQGASTNDQNITVNLDGDSTPSEVAYLPIYTQNEWNITFSLNSTGTMLTAKVTTPDKKDSPNSVYEIFNVNFTEASNELVDATFTALNVSMASKDDVSDDKVGMSQWGVLIEQSYDSTAMDNLKLTLPKDQTEEVVYVTSGVTKTTQTTGGGEVTSTTITPINVGAAKLDTEVADIKAVNAIVVGGPCANAAAAALMNNPANCAEGFAEGKAVVKLYENGENIAVLVAGMTALDTRRASRALASGKVAQGVAAGVKEAEVSGTTISDITVSSVTA